MKLITTTILIFSFALLKAQTNTATPNAGFENWTHFTADGGYDDPDSMNCLNPTTAPLGTVTCYKDSTDPHSGKYDLELVTEEVVSIEVAPGAATTGAINTSNQTINGGIPYTLRPDSIIGWYRYAPQSGDNGDIEFYLFGANHTDTIGQAFFKTPTTTVSAWTRISLAITYTSSATPDTALWIFSSSNAQATAQVGSQLYVDDLGLVFDTSAGIYSINNPGNITIGPNPTSGMISINNISPDKSLVLALFDVTGRKVEEQKIGNGANYISLTGVSEGVYIYFIQNEQNAIVKTGKIVVQR